MIATRARGTLEARFWRQVDVTDGCWVWLGALKDGYGRITTGGAGSKIARAHRLSYEMHIGEIPEGCELHHICANRACVRPDHLEPVTRREHMLRTPRSIMARKAAQTHCGRGHELAGDNVYVWHGRRYCRECRRHLATKHPDYDPTGEGRLGAMWMERP